MEKTSRKNKNISNKIHRYKVLLTLLVIVLIALIAVFVNRVIEYNSADREARDMLKLMAELKETDNDVDINLNDTKIKGYQVIGSIKIDSIELEYPILEKTTTESLNLSITKFSGPELNGYGNVTLAGHNNRNGKLFSKLIYVKFQDIIEVTDMESNTVKYKVNNIYTVDPTDISCTNTDNENIKELTLITCTSGGAKRLVIKASEII